MNFLNILSKIYKPKNVVKNLSYGDGTSMFYDEFPGAKKSLPVVIFWHGGGWQTGNKSLYGFVGIYFQKLGYNSVVANYPKYPDQTFPGFIKDANHLVDVIKKKYPKSKIFLAGHSAGGHTALITAMKRSADPVDGVIALAPAVWFAEKTWSRWQKIFTQPYESKKQEVYSYVENGPKSVRYLLIHGSNDATISHKDSIKLHEFLSSGGFNSKLEILPVLNHWAILSIFTFRMWPKLKQSIKNFIDA